MHRHRAFTLVELLVVIGVIAVLISILLPVLGRAREAARTVACLSNQRQIGMAFSLYVQGVGKGYPPIRNRSTVYGTTYGRPTWDMALLELIRAPQVFWCPADVNAINASYTDDRGETVRGKRSYAVHSNPGNLDNDRGGLFFDENTANGGWPGIVIKFSRIPSASGTFLIVDRHTWSRSSNMYNDMGTRFGAGVSRPDDLLQAPGADHLPWPAHRKKYNWLFVDGHAETMEIRDTYGSGNVTSPKKIWTRWED